MPLQDELSVDVAIVGAGFAGLSAAYRLATGTSGATVAVLDANRIAEGPAGRNSGFMIDLPHDLASDDYSGGDLAHDRSETVSNRLAIAYATGIATECGMGSDLFDPCGKLNVASSAHSDRLNRDYVEQLQRLGEPFDLLDARAVQAVTGSNWYISGVRTPGTVMLQPAGYLRALAERLRVLGVALFENSAVRTLSCEQGSWRLTTERGCVNAERVIMATNGHAASFGLHQDKLIHISTFASMTDRFDRALLGGQSTWGATPANPMGTTVRRIDDGDASRILVRTVFANDPALAGQAGAKQRTWSRHDARFHERFPMLAGVSMAYRWGGHLCLTRNGAAVHGELERGLYSAVCQNGLGTTKGTLAGLSAADLACGIDSEATRAMCGGALPQRLPPAPFAALGIGATLAWKQWRAGRE